MDFEDTCFITLVKSLNLHTHFHIGIELRTSLCDLHTLIYKQLKHVIINVQLSNITLVCANKN